MRIGHGYDVHRFSSDRDLILGGVKIPNDMGLLGHSDADVLLHAISDALLVLLLWVILANISPILTLNIRVLTVGFFCATALPLLIKKVLRLEISMLQ